MSWYYSGGRGIAHVGHLTLCELNTHAQTHAHTIVKSNIGQFPNDYSFINAFDRTHC